VGQSTFTPQLAHCPQQQTQLFPTDNPAFFRVTQSDLSAAMAGIDPASISSSFGSHFAANSSQSQIPSSSVHVIADYISNQMSPEAMQHDHQSAMLNSDSIPDIILTGEISIRELSTSWRSFSRLYS
jgi:hypothetical protein